MVDAGAIRRRFRLIEKHLDERMRRLVAAAEAEAVGVGGVSLGARATGVSRRAIRIGTRELRARTAPAGSERRIRRPGGGRKRTVEADPRLVRDLEHLIEPTTRGDPESPLRGTCKSVRRLAAELSRQGHTTSHRMVAELLHDLNYSLHGNRKTIEGAGHPDRNAQFEHIAARVRAALRRGDPAISVDTKKKEVVGPSRMAGANGGRRATQSACGCTTSSCRGWGARSPTACMIWGRTRAGSAWGSIMTPRRLPWRAFAGGGSGWAPARIRTPTAC